jgi:hypothetical protein
MWLRSLDTEWKRKYHFSYVGKENLRKIFGPVKENGAWGIRNIQE